MKKLFRSLGSIPSLLAGGTATVLAVALHSWPICALGLVACAALAVADARHRTFSFPRVSDPETARALGAIVAARTALDRSMAGDDRQAFVGPLLSPIADLDANAAKLARRADEIGEHLRRTDVGALQREIAAIDERLVSTRDDETRAHYHAARDAHMAHLATVAELTRTKERIAATLMSIAATLDGLPAKVVRLRALERESDEVGRDLAAMNEEIESFESTLLHIHGAT